MDHKNHFFLVKDQAVIKKNSLDKSFLLVFHGGFVGYLLLHNLVIPIIGNMGRGYPFFTGISLYFLTHGWLFYVFATTKRKGDISLPFIFNFSIFIFSFVVVLMDLKDGIDPVEFSRLISLAAMSIFFLVFLIRFKNFFSWNLSFKKILPGVFIGIIFVVFQISLQRDDLHRKGDTVDKKEVPLVVLSLPSDKFSQKEIEITSHFKESVVLLPLDSSITLRNNSHKNHLIRLEYIKNNRWYFKKIIKMDKQKKMTIPFETKGFFRLYSPSSKIGICHLVVGSNLFKKNTYLLGKKGAISK